MAKKEKYRILFVDDDKMMIDIIKKQLKDMYIIDTANNASEGIELIKKNHNYNVVIADFKMPGLDGIKFLEKVKEISPVITRIMLTGNADLDVAINAINKGNIFKFLTKPCMKQDLIDTINSGLENYEEDLKMINDSLKDELTGLWNRRYFDLQLKKTIKNAKRYGYKFSLVYIDINDFKEINDNYGHDIGDEALKTLSNSLVSTCRKSDIISRYGGDEFVVLLYQDEKVGAQSIIKRLKENLKNKYINRKSTVNISIASGIALFPTDETDEINLMKKADHRMYENKRLEKSE